MTSTEITEKVLGNTFGGGMLQDSYPYYMNTNMYRYALNAVYGSHDYKTGFLVNEKSNKHKASFPGKVVGASYIDERDQTLVFTADGTISLFDHKKNSVTPLYNGCWDFSKCEMMYAKFKTMQPCNETIAYFSSGCHYYRINIDELLDPARSAGLTCNDFRLFRCASNPHVIPEVHETGGHGLEAGAYYFVVQLEDRDGNKSNWGFLEGPARVGSTNNIPGEASGGVIELKIDYLDPKYNIVNIAVIKKIDGQLREPELIFSRHYNTSAVSFTYYSPKQLIQTLSFEEIFNKRKLYLRGQDLYQKDGRLFLYKIRQERNLNYQTRANQALVQGVVYEVSSEYAHLFPSLQRGERYVPAIVWVYCDGTTSAAFPLGGGGGGGGVTFSRRRRANDDDFSEVGPLDNRVYDEVETEHRDGKNLQAEKIDTAGQEGVGGGSPRPDYCFYPPELWRRRLPEVPATEEVGGCDDIDILNIPVDLREEEIDRVQEDVIEAFTTTIQDMVEAVELAEDEDAAQCCLCYGSSTICLDNVDNGSGGTCELPAHCCPSGSPCPNGDNARDAVAADLPDWEQAHTNWGDWLADYGIDEPEPQIISGSLKETALNMYKKIVREREVILYSKGRYEDNGGSTGGAGGSFDRQHTGADSITADGNPTKEGFPTKVGAFGFKRVYSTELYPTTKDCNGNFLWGDLAGTPVVLFETPTEAEQPLVRTGQVGTVSRWTPENTEWGNTTVRILGMRISGIQFPSAEELSKPLSSTMPYKIVYVKRDESNSTILANGAFFGTFSGGIRGQTHMFPRHGANSFEHVDRHVDEGGSHIAGGGAGATNKYIFHSPDTSLRKPSLLGGEILYSGSIGGRGWRHGLYAKGQEPRENQVDGTRVDQRGCRQSLNLNQFSPGGSTIGLSGIMYAEADRIVSPVAGIDTPLMNKHRESCVYLQTEGQLPGLSGGYSIDGHRDRSFIGDVLDHMAPITGETWKGSIRRDIPDQYGNPENQTYIDLGLDATKDSGSAIEGWCGDVFVGMHAVRRTGFVSEKVGNEFDIPALVTHKKKKRTICDSPEDEIFMFTGNNFYATKLPETGDAADAKNWAGLHSPGDAITRPATTRAVNKEVTVGGADEQTEPETDYYYPKVVKTLVTFWCESKVNLKYRQTGSGPQKITGNVYYPNLKDLWLDSNAPYPSTWEDSWLNRFYVRVEQPSQKKIWRKTLIRTLLTLGVPSLFVGSTPFIEDYFGWVAGMLSGPFLVSVWMVLARTLFNDQYTTRLLTFPVCKTDNEGGEDEAMVVNFEDNYFEYDSTYSSTNDVQSFRGMPENYYTCACDQCDKNITTNEIYYSNKQVLQSPVDAYKNFHSNSILDLPANSGQLQKLFSEGNSFYAHTTDKIWVLQFANTSELTGENEAFTGRSDLLAEPLEILEDIPEGFMGTIDPNASINTPIGYIFIDRQGDKIVQFSSGGGFKVLSDLGMFSFFREHLNFCTTGCTDERVSGRYYALGWDHRNNRLLVTKKDGAYSWTMSYNPEAGTDRAPWISFHSYVPSFYVWDRHHLYSIDNSSIWLHDHEDGDYQSFYGQYHPFIVEYIVRDDTGQPFMYQSSELNTNASILKGGGKLLGRNVTFTKAAFWTTDQSTGIMNLVPDFKFDGYVEHPDKVKDIPQVCRLTRNMRVWQMNEMMDNVINPEDPVVVKNACEPYYRINEANIKYNSFDKQYINRILFDKLLYNRLIFDNFEYKNVELILDNVQTLVKTNV